MAYDIPTRFHKVWSRHLREMCQTNFWWKKERKKKNNTFCNKNNKKWSKHNMSPKLCLGDINIKSVLVLVNHHFLILGEKKRDLMSGQNFFSQQIIFFFTKTLMIMKTNVMISRMIFLILNKYWECQEITEYLKIYSWSKHVKQINQFLMAMRNMFF